MKKGRVLFPVLFALLTVVSVTELAAAPPILAAAGAPAAVEISSEEFLCNLSQASALELPGSTPALNRAVEVCGTCGQDLCDNRNVGASCYDTLQGFWGWCIPPWGGYCADGRPNCQCATEYQ
jgi:hypothetical protein